MFNGKTHYKLPFSIAMLNYPIHSHYLVGGAITILKNDGVRQLDK
jgi:hypothetical protein